MKMNSGAKVVRVGGLIALMVLFACSSEPSASLPPEMQPEMPFKSLVIDAQPPGADADCCTDVAALGDINGDGFLDVVIGAETDASNALVWYAYPEWTRRTIGSGKFTTDGTVADVDGDGDADIVISEFDPNNIEWWENGGSPEAPNNWTRHLIGNRYAHDLTVVDVNGDGRLDVVKSPKGDAGGWFEAPPDPRTPWTFRSIPGMEGEGLDTGDLDGDGDTDVAESAFWFENTDGAGQAWQRHDISANWSRDCRVVVADMNGDNRPDIVLSHSEGNGRLSWFANPASTTAAWPEHPIETSDLQAAHSLAVDDFDGDGRLDVFTGEMHTSATKRVLVYRNEGGDRWERILLDEGGTHNAQVGDVDQDGDPDIVGKNYGGSNRAVRLWENLSVNRAAAQRWTYSAIDSSRPPEQFGKMGLVFSDLNADGYDDVIAGSLAYLNPQARLDTVWERVVLPAGVDVYFATNVDDDDQADLVGARDTTLVWLEAEDGSGRRWTEQSVGTIPPGRTQGYTTAQLVPGEKPQLVFTRAQNLFYADIPAVAWERWPVVRVSSDNEEEGVAAGDIDRDGDLDLVAQAADGHHVIWFENTGGAREDWPQHTVGTSEEWLDRIALADINADGRLDIVVTEETQTWTYNARVYWYEAPAEPHDPWSRHTIAVFRSVNSMDLADMNGDGAIDVVVAEHTDQTGRKGASDNITTILENQEAGSRWVAHIVEIGPHSSHLGAQLDDLDRDGDLDLVSIGWDQYRFVHLWENRQIQ